MPRPQRIHRRVPRRLPGRRMSIVPVVLLAGWLAVALLGVAWLGAAAPRASAEDAPTSPWRDEALLARRLAEALTAVEASCGAPYPKSPTVRVSTKEEVAGVLKSEIADQVAALGGGTDVDQALTMMAGLLLAKYDTAANVIHVLPANVEEMARALGAPELLGEGVLRVILAHEATHALDFQRFPLVEARASRTTQEGMLAYGAAVEGHAQLIAERVAAGWGLEAAFAAYTRTITAVPAGLTTAQKLLADALAAQVGFGYLKGHAFLKAVEAARGRDGVEAVLRAPPQGVREVERPELWLDPTRGGAALDPTQVFAKLIAAAEGTSAGWTRQTVPVLVSALETQLAILPAEERRQAVEGFEDGQVVVVNRGATRMVVGFVGRFATPEAAARFDATNAAVMRKKDELMRSGPVRIVEAAYTEGIGTGGARPGLAAVKTVAQGEQRQTVRVWLAHVGRHVVEITAVNVPDLTPEAADTAVDAALGALDAAPR